MFQDGVGYGIAAKVQKPQFREPTNLGRERGELVSVDMKYPKGDRRNNFRI